MHFAVVFTAQKKYHKVDLKRMQNTTLKNQLFGKYKAIPLKVNTAQRVNCLGAGLLYVDYKKQHRCDKKY